MKKKLMATTMAFALCAMASSAFASQSVNLGTQLGSTPLFTPINGSASKAPLNPGNSNGLVTIAANGVVETSAEKAKKIGVTEKQLLAYYEKYNNLNVNKANPNKIKTLAERQAEINRFPASSQSEKLIKQWEQKQINVLIQHSEQAMQLKPNQITPQGNAVSNGNAIQLKPNQITSQGNAVSNGSAVSNAVSNAASYPANFQMK
ncbi:hypothetical protein EEL30_02625 [Brevibacillus laterosporus]|uniref:DUF2680 domain-containing protein n=1 Tax=Brevibacillus laterosporus TaxID=1465 RepID=A0A518V2Y7_BRELA|nr:hypothetical protein EEL30_02625 [Brevibacillus laterosporus]